MSAKGMAMLRGLKITNFMPNPPFPKFTRLCMDFFRVLPGLSMLVVAGVLLLNKASSPFFLWMHREYGFTVDGYGIVMLVMALAGLVWPLTSEKIIRAPGIDAGGMIFLTFPLWFLIFLILRFTASAVNVSLLGLAAWIIGFVTQVMVYLLTCSLRLWELNWHEEQDEIGAALTKGKGMP